MRRENRTYYFSVEGDTEQWYLEWLQRTINAEPTARYTVKLDCKIQKDPVSRVKRMTVVGKTEITHNSGKNIKYHLGYSNFTFELWMILHMNECNGVLTHRQQYLNSLNRAYGENFENLEQYKEEKNFKRILGKLTLEHVKQAVHRSETIMRRNEDLGNRLQQYKGYCYYKENPSLTVWEQIKRILQDCGIL